MDELLISLNSMSHPTVCFEYKRHGQLSVPEQPRVTVCLVCLRELIGRVDELERQVRHLANSGEHPPGLPMPRV